MSLSSFDRLFEFPPEAGGKPAISETSVSGVELANNLKLALLFGQLRRDAPHRIHGPINGDAYIIQLTSG